MAKNWIAGAIKHPGALTEKAKKVKGGVKNGKITEKGYAALGKSKNPTTKKQVNLAKTLKAMHK